jgi:hypothetical protein
MEFQSHETYYYHTYEGYMKYYEYDKIAYAPTFPIAWAKNHLPNTGPECCKTCKTFGFWNGAFIGYCSKCSEKYEGKRGNGFVFYGEEKKKLENSSSAFYTYLRDIDLDNIGDKEIFDSAALVAEINAPEEESEEEFDCFGCTAYYGSDYNGGYDSY